MALIAQYIENYLDLIENSPNEIIRQITRLHEKNHLFSKLNKKLEDMLKILVDNESNTIINKKEDNSTEIKDKTIDKLNDKTSDKTIDKSTELTDKQIVDQPTGSKDNQVNQDDEKTTLRKQKALNSVKLTLLEIQEVSDEKISIVQSILEHLDFKNKQLDSDFRNISNQTNLNQTNSKSNSNSSSQKSNDEESLNGNQENSNLESNYNQKDATVSVPTSQSNVNNHHSSNSKRASSRRNLTTGNSKQQEFTKDLDLNSSHNNGQNSNNGNTSSNHKRGVKRGGGTKNNSNKDIKRNRISHKDPANSPTCLYDETPIDPDEPTYCVCEQVSFGEMICCDNAACVIEWFHFQCVSLTTKPKGKWFCPNCRGDRSNIPKSKH